MELCGECSKWYNQTDECCYFFRILIDDFHQQLWLPPMFEAYMKDGKCGKASLTGPSGKEYCVQLKKMDNIFCFKDGWCRFLMENSLHENDVLLFRYDGRLRFVVEAFGESACQKAPPPPLSLFGGSADATYETGGPSRRRDQSSDSTQNVQSDDEISDSTEGSEDDEVHHLNETLLNAKNNGKGYRKYFISGRRPVTLEEKRRAFRAAASYETSFPSFTATMTPTCVYKGFYMNIPIKFVRGYKLLSQNAEVKLQTEGGKKWTASYVRRGASTVGLAGGGWCDFVYDNNIEEGDVCVFELIKNTTPMKMKVVIFRVVEETTPLIKGR